MWKDYFPAVDAIVFLVDAYDRARFPESKSELCSLLADEQLAHCPIVILGNKIDRPGAASEEEIRGFFELHNTTGKVLVKHMNASKTFKNHPFCYQGKTPRSELSSRPLELFMCSVLKRQGYGEGFRWLAQYID